MINLHCLALPHTISNDDYVACAFTQKVRKFLTMFKDSKKYKTIHYGHEDSVTDAHEHVTVTDNAILNASYGEYNWRKGFFKHDRSDLANRVFNTRVVEEVSKRKKKGDLLLVFWAASDNAAKEINKDNDILVVEPGIGCAYAFAPFRCYESYPLKAAFMGTDKVSKCNPEWFWRVVPNYFDLNDFESKPKREPYAVALGRIGSNKGTHIAIDACARMNIKLLIAGQGDASNLGLKEWPEHVQYIGYADKATRKKLLSEASFSFLLSTYWEPFGGTAVESMLSGCVPICTDAGAMTEYIVDGVNGFRCNTMGDILRAIRLHETINRERMIKFAQSNFSLDAVRPKFERAFNDFEDVFHNSSWYVDHNRPLECGLGIDYKHLYVD